MHFRIVTIGASLGGLNALSQILGVLEPDFPVPIAVVQHRAIDDSEAFGQFIGEHTSLRVVEVEDKQRIEAGCIYIGPANYHLIVDRDHFSLSTDQPVLNARPSIDVLFESAADTFGSAVLGVLLTGASKDGTLGLARIKSRRGFTIVQDPGTAEATLMPSSAIARVRVDKILPLPAIGPLLEHICRIGLRPAAITT
jgi:two-component system chemotaxis response regulator CheB